MKNGGRIIQAFLDVDMRMQYDGLRQFCEKENIIIEDFKPGTYVLFFNTKRTIVRILAANRVFASRKLEHGRFYDLTCAQGIVEAFNNSGEISYEKVLRKTLEAKLARKQADVR